MSWKTNLTALQTYMCHGSLTCLLTLWAWKYHFDALWATPHTYNYIYIYIYIYIYTYEQENSVCVCVCCIVKIKQKTQCLFDELFGIQRVNRFKIMSINISIFTLHLCFLKHYLKLKRSYESVFDLTTSCYSQLQNKNNYFV